jgi:hypothetical protein
MLNDEAEKKNKCKKHEKKPESIQLTHKTHDLGHKTEITQ